MEENSTASPPINPEKKSGFFKRWFSGLGESLTRFSFSLATTLIGVICLIWNVKDHHTSLIHIAMVCGLGIPLFYCVRIYSETRNLSQKTMAIINVVLVLLLTGYYFTLPSDFEASKDLPYIRYILLFIAVHLLVAFIPFIFRSNEVAFWNYNRISFSRLFVSLIFSHILYAGVALIYGALIMLFSVRIRPDFFFQTYIAVAGIFNTWFFFAGIPKNWESLEEDDSFPKNFKILTMYILLPLIATYLGILLMYEAKILLDQKVPKGIVSYMILVVAVVGVLDLLLMYPLKRLNEKLFKRIRIIYFTSLVPLQFLLYYAIYLRISDYGITENRYFLIAIALWLTGVIIYFLAFGRKIKIEWVPISLFILVSLSSFGPWGAFHVSKISQKNRMINSLKSMNLYQDGKYVPRENFVISDSTASVLFGSMEYLVDRHGTDYINEILKLEKPIDKDDFDRWNSRDYYSDLMGIEIKYKEVNTSLRNSYMTFTVDYNEPIDPKGFTKCYFFNQKYDHHSDIEGYFFRFDQFEQVLSFTDEGGKELSFDLKPFIAGLTENKEYKYRYELPQSELILKTEQGSFVFSSINANLNEQTEKYEISNIQGMLLIP